MNNDKVAEPILGTSRALFHYEHRKWPTKVYPGSKFGAASEGRLLSQEEKTEWAKRHGFAVA